MSEHTLKTKWTHFKSHNIKVIAIVYWESVKLMIFSTEWIFHARWWSLDTLPNILYPIFHVRMSTSERRSVNHNSNLIKVVILPQCIENHHRKPTSQYWANTTTLMRFELWLKEHCTQKKIWIHLMQNIFRNQTVKNLTILDNPFKRYDFSKFSLNSVKSLCRSHKLATVPCHGCTTPHWFCTQIITNFQFSWIWVKLLIKLIPKSIQIHIYPKQTWLISRGNLLFTWELYF